ncbi:MAG: TetR/AcrR family transcriptional regulator, mexJK operon transcriptional repressor [Desulfovibrionales bacterium]|jgi:AcrR family transcriptional regulator|nr:TetR/AcrR family transcriptional regulator, mexJK operon transcriptional repressor [Desulfovibrionales bacterium]
MEATTPKRSQRGRPKTVCHEQQKALIASAAQKLFAENGYARTTVDKIAATCRVSKQTLYRLFPTKLALFAAAVEAHRLEFLHFSPEYDNLPLDEALEKIFKIDNFDLKKQLCTSFLRLALVESARFPELKATLRRHGGDTSRRELSQWLEKQHRRGRIRVDDAFSAATILLDMVFGSLIRKEMGEFECTSAEHRRQYVKLCISVFLHGVEVEQPLRASVEAQDEARTI